MIENIKNYFQSLIDFFKDFFEALNTLFDPLLESVEAIGSFFRGVAVFVRTFTDGIGAIFSVVGNTLSMIGVLPSFILTFAICGISISLILLILGRK